MRLTSRLNGAVNSATRPPASNKRRLLNVYLKLNIIFCLKQASVFAFEFWAIGGIKLKDQGEANKEIEKNEEKPGKNEKFEFCIERRLC